VAAVTIAAPGRDLIRRGQAEGVFRADLPATWLASVLHHVMHGAAIDVAKGRLDPIDAPRFISDTVLAAYAPSNT
jgi:hypothetical protein